MPKPVYLYTLKYDIHNAELCKLELRQLFGQSIQQKTFLSHKKIDPSISPFLKNRIEIISSSSQYHKLIDDIQQKQICMDGFKVEFLRLGGDTTSTTEKQKVLKDIGYSIHAAPNFKHPSITFAACKLENTWYFGTLSKHSTAWYKHKQKPHSLSISIGMDVAKALVSIASQGNKNTRLLDACCGVGTVMLEACWAGFFIEGCDINWHACKNTRQNLAHYNYLATAYCTDIKDLHKHYDAAIIDLPYNLFTYSTDAIAANIIRAVAALSARVVIVSMSDIEPFVQQAGLKVTDYCTVEKKGKSKFTRSVWVCEQA